MPIQFNCPHCGRQTYVADEYAGQTGPCATCGKSITVPTMAGPPTHVPPPGSSGGTAPIVIGLSAALVVAFVCGGGLLLMCGGTMTPMFRPPGPPPTATVMSAGQPQCNGNLRQIGLAMHNYHDTYGTFPPAYVADEDGQPMHSWRVLLLPFLDREDLYEQYDFDEPWDSPNNLAVAEAVVDVYCCPDEFSGYGTETSYLMIVGPDTISDGPGVTKLSDIKDGTSCTILVVEAAGSGIGWTEPTDLDAESVSYQVNDPLGEGIRSDHPGAHVLMCDGTVHAIDEFLDPRQLEAMTTISSGEAVDPLDGY